MGFPSLLPPSSPQRKQLETLINGFLNSTGSEQTARDATSLMTCIMVLSRFDAAFAAAADDDDDDERAGGTMDEVRTVVSNLLDSS